MALTWEQSDLNDSVMVGIKNGEKVCIIVTHHLALNPSHTFVLLEDQSQEKFEGKNSYDKALGFAEELFS